MPNMKCFNTNSCQCARSNMIVCLPQCN